MENAEPLDGLRGLYQDLSALSDSSLVNIDRLRVELETHIHDFRTLLDKPTKSNGSRMSVLSGKITIDDVEYSVNDEFQQGTLQVADALDLDELLSALLFFRAQGTSQEYDRPPVITAIISFHQRRHFLLESLRLIFQESFEVEREATQEMMQEMLAHVVEIKDGQLRNASLYTRKCLKSMEDIEKWLSLLGEQIQKASIVGQSEDQLVMEAIEHQRFTLLQQHESLGAILCYLFKGPYTSPEDLRILLKHLRKLDRFDGVLVHYIPAIIASFVQHGSPERSGNYQEARSLNTAVIATKDGQNWAHQPFHSAVIALWLAVYSAWDYDGPSSAPPGVDLEREAEERTKTFMTALDDGGLDLLVSICSGVSGEEWIDPARSELVTMLLRESASWLKESGSATLDADSCSPYLKTLLMENFEVFAESCIANMPDAVRKLKTEEDSQRLDQITALRDGLTSNLHRDLVEARTHLESFLLIMAFAFEGRPDAAQEFWADPDGNLYGFLQWSSKRQTVPRVSAFCELLCSISGGEDNATAAHRFLLEEDKFMSSKFKRSASMNWAQMFAELQIYATRVTDKPSTAQTIQRTRKFEPADMSEPESPVMLSCYLRLIGHLSRQSAAVREWMLQYSSFNIVSTLLTLCSGPLPSHLRATVFQALAGLMTDRSVDNGNEMWLAVDQWISSGAMSASAHNKVPLVSNPLIWHEQQAFEKIGESFDQANAFVVLILSLVVPAIDSAEYAIWVPFPESLGSSYRMPGIEPYIDFIMGQALSRKVPDLNERQSRLLTYNSLDFVLTCLRSFNETIVTALNGISATAEPNLKTSTLVSYVRLHPFARVAEWLYNEDVIKTIFATANQEIADVSRASSDSILVSSLVKSIEVMCSIIDLQSTYLNIVRPFIKSQPGSRLNVGNSSLSAFEDCILNNLQIVPKLCLYCGTGHQELTISSLGLLAKLSSSTRLNKLSSPELSRWRSSNKIVEVLNAENLDSVSLPFISQMEPEVRELDAGPQASGYLIRHNLLELLNSSLTMISDRPTVAHLLLGFRTVGNVLDVSSDGLFAAGRSLLHAILGFVQSYPDQLDDNVVPWMLHLKRTAFEVLKHLWSSKLSSYFTLLEMRATGFLVSLFASQPLVGPHTLWDGLPVAAEQFWVCDSTDALAEFLLYRSYLFDYATTEIRSAAKMGSPTLLAAILATLFGSSTLDNGATIANPTVFDLFDFADLDVQFHARPPNVEYLGGLNIDMCEKPVEDGSLVLYNVAQVKELVKARREELLSNGELRPQDDEMFMAEADNLIEFLQARNQSRLINFNRHMALSSWAELLTTILKCSELDGGRKSTFILHAIQLILPKLETVIEDDLPEALDLARLAESLVESLDATPAKLTPPRRNGDLIDEKLHQLFQICVRGIILSNGGILLKETFYNICSIYVARIVSPDTGNESMRQHSQQVVKSSGRALIEAICDDAYTGQETCRISAVLLLNSLATLDKHAEAALAESIAQSNYLSLFIDSIRALPLELRNAPANDTTLLLSYYQSLLSLLQQLCQTKPGATHVLKAGLFQAVHDSQLFAADPDLGIDIDNADALRKYYDLLDSVLRVIVTATFSRGLQNELMIEQTRAFLTENRQSMVGVFKRFAKIGGSAAPDHHDALTSIAKSYTALIAATDFLEVEESEVEHHIGPKLFS
ncbi:nucleoporin Nup186/Nup192/Nup205 [Aspergillus falconensis]